jgi:hypothetical protein
VLLPPFFEKQGKWKHVLKITPKFVEWDGVTEFDDYWGDFSEDGYAEDKILTMLVNGKLVFHDDVFEVKLINGVLKDYVETERKKKIVIDYNNDDDIEKKIKKNNPVFEFFYNYDQTVASPCCIVSSEVDPKLGVAMIVVIY